MVTRDPGTADDTWDETTGRYTEDGRELVYEGPGTVSSRGASPAVTVEAGQGTVVTVLTVSIPLESPTLRTDDLVEVLDSMRSPHLVEHTYIVRAQRATSYAVQQTVYVDRHEGKHPR